MPKASHDRPGDRSQLLKEREMNYKTLLLKSEMRFQLLAERTPLGMAIVDHEGFFEVHESHVHNALRVFR